jgi:hypothetical protein
LETEVSAVSPAEKNAEIMLSVRMLIICSKVDRSIFSFVSY